MLTLIAKIRTSDYTGTNGEALRELDLQELADAIREDQEVYDEHAEIVEDVCSDLVQQRDHLMDASDSLDEIDQHMQQVFKDWESTIERLRATI